MTNEEAIDETLRLAVHQLRKAANLLRMGEDEDVSEASELVLSASNTLTTALWMRRRDEA